MPEIIKILHIFGRMQRGGAEMRTLDLMRHVDRQRYEFHFCALSGLPGDLDDEIRSLGGTVHLLPLGRTFPRQFRRLLQEERFDVVQSHVHFFSGYILRLAAKEDIPVRVTHFRTTDDGQGNGVRRCVQRRIMRRWIDLYSTHILAVSQGSMAIPWGPKWQRDDRCQIIYNGLDGATNISVLDRDSVFQEFGLPHDTTLYIHVGRINEEKNHVRLVAIFAEIAKVDPTAHLLLVGRGGNNIEHLVRKRVAKLMIADQVVFAGVRSDVRRLLAASDIMLFPSLREGLPGAVLEAAAVGTPVLGSDVPGIIEIAQALPLVRHMSLNVSNQHWATNAVGLCSEGRELNIRAAAIEAFGNSMFTIEQCAKAHYAVWDAVV